VDGPHLVIDYFATRNSRTGKNKGDAQGGVVQKDSMCRLAVLAQTFAMVAQSGHQRTRREPHLFQPAEEPAYVLIHVSNFTGVGVASVKILVGFRRIIRDMWIVIVGPQEESPLAVLLKPSQSSTCNDRRAALR